MNVQTFSPYIHLATRSFVNKNFYIKKRVIYDYELIYLEIGQWILTVDDIEYPCKAGDIMLIRPGVPHSIKGSGLVQISQPHIHFDIKYDLDSPLICVSFKDESEMTVYEKSLIRQDCLPFCEPIIKIKDLKAFKKIFFSVIENNGKNSNSLSVKGDMLKILDIIIKDNFENEISKTPNNIISDIKNYIDYHYESRITLEQLSLQFNYNVFYIEKSFKKIYGISVIKYYNNLRIQQAKKLLIELKHVGKVSEKLNFSDIYTFSRFFKKAVGISPTQYIKQHN